MQQPYKLFILALCVSLCSISHLSAQSFKKGSLLVSLSEGATLTNYSTSYTDANNHVTVAGNRDPLSVEYGLSSKWGIGLTSGADVLKVDINKLYNTTTPDARAKVVTGEFTADVYYHFFVTRRFDISAYASLGGCALSTKGVLGDPPYKYTASGNIVRMGVKGRYYVTKRFGLLNILSAYDSWFSTKHITGNTFGNGYNTNVKGLAWEFGLCYRILR